ncbi:MAG: PadR family transcriptional regulator [Dictyoglomus sp. NZ13-RE01]|nr:MAG: PadR family transcriptional regulator [Dictyoglomus sp. NZ13-RE01]
MERIRIKKVVGLSPGFWLRMWILTCLGEGELHGYEIINRISEVFPGIISSGISGMGRGYKILRELELEGLVVSKWDVEEKGPAKRVYRLTPKGLEAKEESIKYIMELKEYIEKFLEIAGGEDKDL